MPSRNKTTPSSMKTLRELTAFARKNGIIEFEGLGLKIKLLPSAINLPEKEKLPSPMGIPGLPPGLRPIGMDFLPPMEAPQNDG